MQLCEAPPPLPDDEQLRTLCCEPRATGPGAVPGTWVRPPVVGALWTPGYWRFLGGAWAGGQQNPKQQDRRKEKRAKQDAN